MARADPEAPLPFPSFHDLPLHAYWCPDTLQSPMVTFMTARAARSGARSAPHPRGPRPHRWEPRAAADALEALAEAGVRQMHALAHVRLSRDMPYAVSLRSLGIHAPLRSAL